MSEDDMKKALRARAVEILSWLIRREPTPVGFNQASISEPSVVFWRGLHWRENREDLAFLSINIDGEKWELRITKGGEGGDVVLEKTEKTDPAAVAEREACARLLEEAIERPHE